MKASFLFINLFLFTQLLSQKTYYNLLSNGLNNVVLDMELHSDKIYLSSANQKLINPNQLNEYTTVSSLNLEGTFISNLELTNLNTKKFGIFDSTYCFNRLSIFENNLIVSGHEVGKDQETKVHVFNPNLEVQKEFSIPSTNAERIGNEGIFVEDSILYSYGLLQNNEVLYANIIKYNLNTNTVIWDKNYKKGKRLNQMWDFQKTHDGNYIFIINHNDADAGSGSNSGYQIIKIDIDGEILNTFSHEDLIADKQRILGSREGAIYFTTEDNLLAPIIPTNGRINKLSENMDTILWSLELPSNAFTNGNMYEIFDYTQATNGDIMACGKVWHMPGGPLVAGPNATYNGFVARVTQQGELKWSRIYRLPNDNPKLPNDEYGNFRAGQLDKILETENGNFVLGGTAYYSSVQRNSGKLQFGDTLSSLWIMVVDENGCIEGEECDEVIHLDSKVENLIKSLKYVSSDNVWNVGPVFDEKPSRFTFSKDSTLINDKYYFQKLLSSTETGDFDKAGYYYYREENGVVYELDTFDNKERIIFNFYLKIGDSISVNKLEQEMKLTVLAIDSVVFNDNIYRKRTTLKCINNDEYEWVEGFGTTYLIHPYCYLDNSDGTITCFYINGNLVFENEYDLPCWYLGVETDETENSTFSIYPNPANDKLFIKSDIELSSIKIYGMDGRLKGEYYTNEISLDNYENGVYLIELLCKNNDTYKSKFVKVE